MPVWKFTSVAAEPETALEDASLDLAAYYQSMEDLASWLRAHDGLEIEDLASELSAWYESMEDLGLDMAAWHESLEDMPASLAAAAFMGEDVRALLHAAALSFGDLMGWFRAVAESREDLTTSLMAGKDAYHDLFVYAEATNGIVRVDWGLSLEVLDNTALNDFGIWLGAIVQPPAFRSVVAQRLMAVTEVALGIVVDEGGDPVVTVTGETVTIS